MAFLLDTNCWMQLVRKREHVDEVRALLTEVPDSRLKITDFSLHSIGVLMRRHKVLNEFPSVVSDLQIGSAVEVLSIPPDQLKLVVDASATHAIDFDDAYQHAAAEMNGLTLVTFDLALSRKTGRCLTPVEALQRFKDEQQKQP